MGRGSIFVNTAISGWNHDITGYIICSWDRQYSSENWSPVKNNFLSLRTSLKAIFQCHFTFHLSLFKESCLLKGSILAPVRYRCRFSRSWYTFSSIVAISFSFTGISCSLPAASKRSQRSITASFAFSTSSLRLQRVSRPPHWQCCHGGSLSVV